MEHRVFVAIFLAVLKVSLGAAQEDSDDVPDSFQLFEKFPLVVAITDSDNDTIFECMTAARISFSKEPKSAEYTWLLHGYHGDEKDTITFHFTEGSSPDTFLFKEGSGSDAPVIGKFCYADNKVCGVMDLPYRGRQCILWVAKGREDSVPQHCLRRFSSCCDIATPKYSKGMCSSEDA